MEYAIDKLLPSNITADVRSPASTLRASGSIHSLEHRYLRVQQVSNKALVELNISHFLPADDVGFGNITRALAPSEVIRLPVGNSGLHMVMLQTHRLSSSQILDLGLGMSGIGESFLPFRSQLLSSPPTLSTRKIFGNSSENTLISHFVSPACVVIVQANAEPHATIGHAEVAFRRFYLIWIYLVL